jgi:hypothetical protein
MSQNIVARIFDGLKMESHNPLQTSSQHRSWEKATLLMDRFGVHSEQGSRSVRKLIPIKTLNQRWMMTDITLNSGEPCHGYSCLRKIVWSLKFAVIQSGFVRWNFWIHNHRPYKVTNIYSFYSYVLYLWDSETGFLNQVIQRGLLLHIAKDVLSFKFDSKIVPSDR